MTAYSAYPSPRRPSPLPLVVAGAAFALAAWMFVEQTGVFQQLPSGEPRTVAPRGELSQYEKDVIDVFEQASPSVAHITTESVVQRGRALTRQEGTGSGFVWDDRGTVVTNWHVVQGAREVRVAFGERAFTGVVINGSPDHDLAILRLSGDVSGLRPLMVGSSADLRVGQTAIAIGNPFGFDQTLTTGVISALNRTVPTNTGQVLTGLIQVDAAINPGNSGGPLLDSAGRMIGVTTAIYSPSGASAGLGFAVPVDVVNVVVPALLRNDAVETVMGVVLLPNPVSLDPELGYTMGVGAEEVAEGYGAHAAGFRAFTFDERGYARTFGDVIVEIDGIRVRSPGDVTRILQKRVPGSRAKVKVVRDMPRQPRIETLEVVLRARQPQSR